MAVVFLWDRYPVLGGKYDKKVRNYDVTRFCTPANDMMLKKAKIINTYYRKHELERRRNEKEGNGGKKTGERVPEAGKYSTAGRSSDNGHK